MLILTCVAGIVRQSKVQNQVRQFSGQIGLF